ncbi:uncharacterized protein cenpt isoform X2 [Hypanus sabinus]|uniref:uncharacterized protein cenpt isoform X2 n=1 Tax=Hypanus sabinus TaxID=79690 RepID=UPI0028C49CB1|nr:uncharacterized protein cenpt isoform X2 [Hypanus sabinus]
MMDSLPEDVTMRTLIKGIIAEEAPRSLVRAGKRSLQKSIGDRMKLTDVSMQQSPHMILRSQMKANVQQSRKQNAATAGSSVERSTRKNSSALRKTKRLEVFPQENLDNYTPRILLKKFMQSELESSLINVSNFKMKKPVEKKSQIKTKMQSNSDSFNLSLPAKDTVEQNLPANRKLQTKLDNTTESQENGKVELSEKSLRPPDISTIVGLISSDFEESTTKPILCRRPKKRKVINEDDFEEGVHNYLEQNKEPEENEIERSGPFEKTAGLTDISGMVGSLNFGTDESVSGPVLSRKPRRLKLVNEEDFEGGVLFYLHQIKEKQPAEVQEVTRNNTGKEKSTTNVQQDERGIAELHTSHQQTLNDGMEAVSVRNEEMRNEFGLDTGLDLEKQMELVASDKEEFVKTPLTGKYKTPRLVEQRILTETDPRMVYRTERFTEDRCEGDKPTGHELEKPKDIKQNLSLHESPTLHYSEGVVVDDMDDKTVEECVLNFRRAEDGETVAILTNTERMDYAEEAGVRAEDAKVVSKRMGDVKADEIIQGAKMKRMESLGFDSEGIGPPKLDSERSGLAGLDGERSGPTGLDGERSGPTGLDGERSRPTGLDGQESGPLDLDGEGSGPLVLDSERSDLAGLDCEGSGPPELDGEGSGLAGLDGEGSGPPELDGEGSGPPELDAEGSGPPELDAEGSSPPELDGEGSNPPELDGEGSGPPELDGEGSGPPELDGNGSGLVGLNSEGSGLAGLDGEKSGLPKLDGEGSDLAGLDSEGSSLAGQNGERSGPPRLDSEGLAVGETDNEKVEETDSDGDIESDEMDEEEDDGKVRWTIQQNEKVLKSSPLLTTPHFLKILGRQARKPLTKVNDNPKRTTHERKKTILPSSFVKSVFTHYAKMKVKKETFTAVDRCLELYFKQLCADMDVYSKHAKRRTIEKEDLELLMKRQGFVTAKMPLNVLIENHLPMECREKLIPMAVSGSKIIPKK